MHFETLNNKWEEILFRFFTHSSLWSVGRFCIDVLEDGSSVSYGRILPSEETKGYLEDLAEKFNISSSDIVLEFGSEVSSRLSALTNATERFQYAAGLKYKFASITNRIPAYERILLKIVSEMKENGQKIDFETGLFSLIHYVLNKLRAVDEIISSVVTVNKTVMLEMEELRADGGAGSVNKLKWLCNTNVAGFVIRELMAKGYIEMPLRKGDLNLKAAAKMCMSVFDFETDSQANLEREMSETTNTLEEFRRQKIKIPKVNSI
ncbi:hypothetical protein [Dyadobacter alkalitolerans]|uniref:hypothetical protein n=1 Tax=Dyadobacter alkalitolerans TaxID=492736 RepID=UPI00041E459A|nr:hypothetical protein [Dyadobacter alkalitolerans]